MTDSPPSTSSAPPVLELKGITKRFGSVVANDRVDFDVRAGEVHALLGENGAGKSTLMSVLYGLYRPTEGEIFVDGTLVEVDSPSAAIKLGIGMVHQHFMLVPVMTVAENIVLGPGAAARGRDARLRGRSRPRARAVRSLRPRRRSRRDDRGRHRRGAATRRDPPCPVPGRAHPRPRRAHRRAHRAGGDGAGGGDPAPEGGRHRDRVHQPQAPRGARGGRSDHRAAPRQADGHGPARGGHRAEPGPARRRARRAAGRRQDSLQVRRATAPRR